MVIRQNEETTSHRKQTNTLQEETSTHRETTTDGKIHHDLPMMRDTITESQRGVHTTNKTVSILAVMSTMTAVLLRLTRQEMLHLTVETSATTNSPLQLTTTTVVVILHPTNLGITHIKQMIVDMIKTHDITRKTPLRKGTADMEILTRTTTG